MSDGMLALSGPVRGGLRDRVLAVRSQPMFEGLDEEGLLLLVEQASSIHCQDGTTITVDGDPSRAVYLVVEGQVVVSRRDSELAVRGAGEAYGALSLLAQLPCGRAVARGTTRLLEVPASAFESALIENYSLLRNTLRTLSASLLAMHGNLPWAPDTGHLLDEGSYYEGPKTLVERLIELRHGPFGRMNMGALVDLARWMTEVRYPAGAPLWHPGDASTYALHVDAGRVRCTSPAGMSLDLGRGRTFGVLDAWSQSRAYGAHADTPLIAFRIDFEHLRTLLETHPEVGLDLLRGFARDLLSNRPRFELGQGLPSPPTT